MKFSSPLVSIMMACYNGRDYLKISIASLINQTYDNWELIFVDDGSTDGSADFVESIGDRRIKIFRFDKNCGRGYARQKAKNEASGDYIGVLDADDWFYSDKIEKQLEFLENNPEIGIVVSGMIFTDDQFNATGYNGCSNIIVGQNTEYKLNSGIMHQRCLFRSDIFKNLNYNINVNRVEDGDFMAKALVATKYAILPELSCVYNLHNSAQFDLYRETYQCRKKVVYDAAKEYPVNVHKTLFILWSKFAVARAVFGLGLQRHFMNRKHQVLTDKMLEQYENEKAAVFKKAETFDY